MTNVLGTMLYKSCMVYIDDVVLFSKRFDEHVVILREVFERLEKANLSLKLEKCYFGQTQVKLLGFVVSGHGVSTDESKVVAVRNFPRPTNLKTLQSFLGLVGYYRHFVQDFAKIAHPLHQLLKRDDKFVWNELAENSFDELKLKLTSSPCLAHFDERFPIRLSCDGCTYGIGAVLSIVQDKRERPVCFYSRSLNKHESRYTISEIECLAFVFALRKARHYLIGRKFTLVTDHHSICFLRKIKDHNARLCRWSILADEFNYDVMYKKGKLHVNADCLSRAPVELPIRGEEEEGEVLTLLNEDLNEQLDIYGELRMAQSRDCFCRKIRKELQTTTDNHLRNQYEEKSGILYRHVIDNNQDYLTVVLPTSLVLKVLDYLHDGPECSHGGENRTWHRVRHRYYMPGLRSLIKRYIASCDVCQRRKAIRTKAAGFLNEPLAPEKPYDVVAIDVTGPLTSTASGNKYIVCAIDRFTRFISAEAFPKVDASDIAQFLFDQIVFRHGCPKIICSDRGSIFVSDLVESLLKILKVRHWRTSSYRPQANGVCERVFGVMKDVLAIYCDQLQNNWDMYLKSCLFAMNTSINDATGFSPHFLLHGFEASLQMDYLAGPPQHRTNIHVAIDILNKARDEAKRASLKAHLRSKHYYDEHRRKHTFSCGDVVLRKHTKIRKGLTSKLMNRFDGPWLITDQFSENTFRILSLMKDTPTRFMNDTVNVERLRPYDDRSNFLLEFQQMCEKAVVEDTGEEEIIQQIEAGHLNDQVHPGVVENIAGVTMDQTRHDPNLEDEELKEEVDEVVDNEEVEIVVPPCSLPLDEEELVIQVNENAEPTVEINETQPPEEPERRTSTRVSVKPIRLGIDE